MTGSTDRPTHLFAVRAIGGYAYDLTWAAGRVPPEVRDGISDTTIGILSRAIGSDDKRLALNAVLSFLTVSINERYPDPHFPFEFGDCATGWDPTFSTEMSIARKWLLTETRLKNLIGIATFSDVCGLASRFWKDCPTLIRGALRKWCGSPKKDEALLAQEMLLRCGVTSEDLPFIRPLLASKERNVQLWLAEYIERGELHPWDVDFSNYPELFASIWKDASQEQLRLLFMGRKPEIVAACLQLYSPSRKELETQLPLLVRTTYATNLGAIDESFRPEVLSLAKSMAFEFAFSLLKAWRQSTAFHDLAEATMPLLEAKPGYLDLKWLGPQWRSVSAMEPFLKSKNAFLRHAAVAAMVSAVIEEKKDFDQFAALYVDRILKDPDKGVRWALGWVVFDLPSGFRERASGRLLGEGWRPYPTLGAGT